jgi:hypothetical protein
MEKGYASELSDVVPDALLPDTFHIFSIRESDAYPLLIFTRCMRVLSDVFYKECAMPYAAVITSHVSLENSKKCIHVLEFF